MDPRLREGRLYVRDERPFAGSRPAAALVFYSPDRKGDHPQAHLKEFRGVIHAGGWADGNTRSARALPCLALGRKNYLLAGSDAGGRRAAAIFSLIQSGNLNAITPQQYLADLLARIAAHPARRIAELLPSNWQ